MKKTLAATVLVCTPMAGAGFAHDHSGAMQIYAAMAKLEANMAEAAGAVILAAAANGDADIVTEAREDYASDLAQIDTYVAFLQGASLNDDQSAAVTSLVEQWGPIAAQGTELLASDDDDIRAQAFTWWESLDGLDDLVDDQLEAILEANNATILE